MSFKGQLGQIGIKALNRGMPDKGIDVTRFFVGGAPVGGLASKGRIWYVDGPNGNDNHLGISPNTAFATLSHALTKVVQDAGDVIWVAPGTIDEAAQVVIGPTMAGVTISAGDYGGTPASRADDTLVSPPHLTTTTFTTAPILKIEASCTIIGLAVSGAFATGASVQVEYDSAGTEAGTCVHFIDCLFGGGAGALHGVLLTGAADITFTRCLFIGHILGTGAGCYLEAGTTDECTCIHWENCDIWINDIGIEIKAADVPVGLFVDHCWFDANTIPIDLNAVNPDLHINDCSFTVADEDAVFEAAYAPAVGHTNMRLLDNQHFLLA